MKQIDDKRWIRPRKVTDKNIDLIKKLRQLSDPETRFNVKIGELVCDKCLTKSLNLGKKTGEEAGSGADGVSVSVGGMEDDSDILAPEISLEVPVNPEDFLWEDLDDDDEEGDENEVVGFVECEEGNPSGTAPVAGTVSSDEAPPRRGK